MPFTPIPPACFPLSKITPETIPETEFPTERVNFWGTRYSVSKRNKSSERKFTINSSGSFPSATIGKKCVGVSAGYGPYIVFARAYPLSEKSDVMSCADIFIRTSAVCSSSSKTIIAVFKKEPRDHTHTNLRYPLDLVSGNINNMIFGFDWDIG